MDSGRWDADDDNCPFHAIIDPEIWDEPIEVGMELTFMSDTGVTKVKVTSLEINPDTGVVGVMF